METQEYTHATTGDVWYRYDDIKYAPPLDEYDNPMGEGRLEVKLQEYKVVRVTPKGVWVSPRWGEFICSDKRWVRTGATKRFACPSLDEARESFVARKRKQAAIHRARAAQAEKAINLIEGLS